MKYDLRANAASAAPHILRTLAAAEGLIVAGILAVGADRLVPDSGLLVLGTALYLPAVIDRIRRSD